MWWHKHWTRAGLSNMIQLTPAHKGIDSCCQNLAMLKAIDSHVRGFTSQILLVVTDKDELRNF